MTIAKTRVFYLALAVLALAAIACGFSPFAAETSSVSTVQEIDPTASPVQSLAPVQDTPVTVSQRSGLSSDLESTLIDLYTRANASVVHILVYTSRNDPFQLGSGSGFVYDAEGHVVTNRHVVADGSAFEVVFADGSHRWANVVGQDVDSDLAVIQAESIPENVSPVVLGDSDALRVGQFVIGIGNPFGEQGSMSLGIISGLGRSLDSQRQLENTGGRYSLPEVIQTDAAINPGNSGGPLLNLAGEVVGVNSAIRTTTGVNSGVGFSIPVNAVRRIVPRLIEEGEYIYSFMGVEIQSLNLTLQARYGLPQLLGAYVTGVTPGGPADRAGLVAASNADRTGGDLIVAINGEAIRDTEQLIAYLVFETDVGQTVELTVIRDGEATKLPMTLGARP